MKYTSLAIDDLAELIFGLASHPSATRSGMKIGGITVYRVNGIMPHSLLRGCLPHRIWCQSR